MWQVILHPAVQDWLDVQPKQVRERFDQCTLVLKNAGPNLGRPLVDSIKGSTIHNLKELRMQSGTNLSIRALFVFDPKRQAIVLVVGDKAGEWNSWYKENLHIAEERYEEYLNHG